MITSSVQCSVSYLETDDNAGSGWCVWYCVCIVCLVLILEEEDYSSLVFAPILSSNRVRRTLMMKQCSAMYATYIEFQFLTVSECIKFHKSSEGRWYTAPCGIPGVTAWGHNISISIGVSISSSAHLLSISIGKNWH